MHKDQTGRCGVASAADPSLSPQTMLPTTVDEMLDQATAAVKLAMAEGKQRHRLDFILPVNEKKYDFLQIEAMVGALSTCPCVSHLASHLITPHQNPLNPKDYPCSLTEEFESAVALAERVVTALSGETDLKRKRLDEGGVEGDPCMLIRYGKSCILPSP